MFNLFRAISNVFNDTKPVEVNPANGLPMIEDSNIDIQGNVFGFSSDSFSTNDTFGSGSFSSFD